jgi:hypothetical protein
MTLNLNIQAQVIDIRNDTPKQSDIFLVDTNVWFWQTYVNATFKAKYYQTTNYPRYLAQALVNDSTLSYSALTLAELASIIERTEREIFNDKNGFTVQNGLLKTAKEYRHNYPLERRKVVAEVQAAWDQVEVIAISADLLINDDIARAALARFQTQAVDGYDLLILEAISRAGTGQVQVITDDMDYATVPHIQVFTSNGRVIQEATIQGKLLRR